MDRHIIISRFHYIFLLFGCQKVQFVQLEAGPNCTVSAISQTFSHYNNTTSRDGADICQSVTREEGREEAGRQVGVGHGLQMRGCNTVNPATRVVSGVLVGYFGEQAGITQPRVIP